MPDPFTFEWEHAPFHDEQQPDNGPLLVAAVREAVTLLGDQWGAAAGPAGRTGHLRNAHNDVFTVGVCEAGAVFLCNNVAGDVMHLPHVDAHSSPARVAEAIADHIGDLY